MKKVAISLIASLAAGTAATPALAQHAGHTTSEPQQSAEQAAADEAAAQCALEAQRHRAMGHQVPEGACEPESATPGSMDHGAMDHTEMNHGAMAADAAETGMTMPMDQPEMDHSQMDQGQMDQGSMATGSMEGMDHSAMQDSSNSDAAIPLLPAPPEAGSGPARAAIAIWGAEAMEEAREALIRDTDGGMRLWFQGDRLEYRVRAGEDGYLWDVQGYYGGDINKFWFKSEGEGSFGEPVEGAEVQALWSRAIAPFFDLQGGIRQDLTGPERTHAVIGIQGLVPYQFEVDAAAFVSNKGDVTARIEAEVDQRITQRLILQPRAEIALSAQDIPELGVGAGLDRIEAGLRPRYEFAREFAPYIGISQEWRIGDSADFARAEGEDPSVTNYVVGLRFWF